MLRIVLTLVTIASVAAPALAQESAEKQSAEKAARQETVDQALRSREYEQAAERIERALAEAPEGEREFLMFRRGLALLYAGKHEAAIEAFARQLKAFPQGEWSHKARFRTADAHVALRQFEAAEKIYAERVRELIGDARKARQAGIYLGFADEFFAPSDKYTQPDYAKALAFYERALDLNPGEELRDDILIRRALCQQKLEQWAAAAESYRQYLLVFDSAHRELEKQRSAASPLPDPAAEAGEHIVVARLRMGWCLLNAGSAPEARRVLQDLLGLLERQGAPGKETAVVRKPGQAPAHGGRSARADEDATGALAMTPRQAWIEAMYLLARTYGLPTPPNGEYLTLGVQVLEKLIAAAPEGTQAIQAAHDIGMAHAHLGRHDAAIAAFRALIDRTAIRPSSDETRELAETLSQSALHTIGVLFAAQKKYGEAIGAWNQYVAKYPSGPHWADAQRRIKDAEYQIGADAVEEKRYEDARAAWTAFLQKYPLDERAAGILYMFGELHYRQEKWEDAIAEWRRLINKYPGTEEAGHAQFMIGRIYEYKTGELEAAIEAYQNLTWSSWAAQARVRYEELNATQLTLITERVFRTDEPAKVRVDVRNIDALTVKLYRLDMHDYFRKTHGMRGVEALDLLLIDPDKTLEVPVEGYARYKPVTQEIEVPFEGPGVWAVYVNNENSEATDARLESTTLVIRSDIDVIIKSSRRQVLVFAQDMLAGKPAAGVQVLVSDGSKVWLNGLTGEDGVWMAKAGELKSLDRMSVFAQRDGHVAGNVLALQGLEFSSGLQARGYLYTDRTMYQPGDAVNIRGILREVKDGQYVLPERPEDEKLRWKLDVVDAKGRVLQTTNIELTAYGTFAAQFRVAADAPVGDYKLVARRAGGPSFAGTFGVQTYQLPQAFLRFEFDEKVILRGTKIIGEIVAEYHYGEPVAGKTVEYEMHLWTGDVIRRSGVTDREGKIPFEFDSTLLPEEGQATFAARQADLNLQAVDAVFVAVRAFRASVEALRPLYLSEEPVEVKVETKDLKGEPVGREMTLTAYLRTQERGQWAETKVESGTVKTDEKSGVGRASLKLVKGGTYVLRAEGRDKFDHVVSAETTVQVSDADDALRLRLFSEKQHYRVGDEIGLDVHSRIGEARKEEIERSRDREIKREQLALVTFEGEEIIGYRIVTIRAGHNPLSVAVGNEHFPNFSIGVSVMAGEKFHAASRDFTVARELHISIKPDREVYRPRDEMTVEIAVTDQQGKPVQGEIGLAMIDQALLERFPDKTMPIVAFFQEGAQRSAALRTETSCTFEYHPSTRGVLSEILAEAERQEEEMQRSLTRAPAALPESAVLTPGQALNQAGEAGQFQDQMTLEADLRTETALQAGRLRFGGGGGGGGQGQLFQDDEQGGRGYADQDDYDDLSGALFHEGWSADEEDRAAVTKAGRELQDAAGVFAAGEQLRKRVDELNAAYSLGIAGAVIEGKSVDKHVRELVLNAPPRSWFPEVAYWNPRIETDAEGKATVQIVVPDSSTKWTLLARGVTAETLVGQAEAKVVSKHDFFVELITPQSFVQGDESTPLVRVHSLVKYSGKIDVTLRVEARRHEGTEARREGTREQGIGNGDAGAGPLAEQTRTIDVDGSGIYDVEFDPIEIGAGGEVIFEVEAATQTAVADARRKLTDAFATPLDVRPWGMRLESHNAGIGRDSDFIEIEPPSGPGEMHDMRLTVAVGPSMQRWVIEEALEAGPRWVHIERDYRCWKAAPPRTHADTASALVGALYAADYARATAAEGRGDKPGGAGILPAGQAGSLPHPAGGATAAKGPADYALLADRVAGLTAQLLAAQNEDGGWAWTGAGGESDPWTTSLVAWGLGKARRDGFAVNPDQMGKLEAYLQKAFADARTEQTELKSIALHGLAWVGEADFAHANRLYRNRQSLSNAALAHLTLVFLRIDRKPIAMELLALLDQRLQETRRGNLTCKRLPATDCSAWMNSELEITALALLGHLAIDPNGPNVRAMVDYLATSARTDGWRPHKARGSVIAALATYYARGRLAAADYTLVVRVNGDEIQRLTSDDAGFAIDLAGEKLAAGKQRVDFEFAGRGEYAYAVTYSGFASEYPKPDRRRATLWAQQRWYAPPKLEYEGRPIDSGFGVTQRHDWFVNRARHVAQGGVVQVQINMGRSEDRSASSAGDRDYIIVQEAIPAGFRLLTETIQGSFLAWDYSDQTLTLYYGSRSGMSDLRYQMVATTPGDYRVPPTIIRSLYRPEVFGVNETEMIAVLPRGQESPDPYKLTPDEAYNLGRMNFNDGRFEAADKYLSELIAGDWLLRDEPYRESIRMLLTCALRLDQPERIVDWFEILKEKYPDLVVPFGDIVRVADAYARTGQHERAYIIYRATADASFVDDSAIAGVLRDERQFLESIDLLRGLWHEYPDTPQVESVYYSTAQTLYGALDNLASIRPRRRNLANWTMAPVAEREQGTGNREQDGGGAPSPDPRSPIPDPSKRVTRLDILCETIAMLERFVTLYPQSPIADEASYSLANAYLDLDDFPTVIARTQELVKLFPDSKWLDRYRYLQALAWFSLGEFEKARELAEKVAVATYRDEQGVERSSPNKWLAYYIIGQIYHAQKDTARAIEYYKKVREHFSDAAEAIAQFEHKFIRLPEVTVFHPDDGGFREAEEWRKHLRSLAAPPARAEATALQATDAAQARPVAQAAASAPLYPTPFIRIDFRNIKTAVLQVYRVDLMKLALVEKNLSEITSVNLAGVKPLIEQTIQLGDGFDYADKMRRVALELQKAPEAASDAAEGAYLVICRGDDLLSSGLVLVTPLVVEVQEDLVSQRTRVSVVDAITRDGVKNVHVKVIGFGMEHFISGRTDLRGVYLADGVAGYPTAIARDPDGRFAFHRSEGAVLAMAAAQAQMLIPPSTPPQERAKSVDYRSNLYLENRALQESNIRRLESMTKQQQQKGVQVRETQ